MRIMPINSLSLTKYVTRRATPGSFSDLVEAMSKKAELKRSN